MSHLNLYPLKLTFEFLEVNMANFTAKKKLTLIAEGVIPRGYLILALKRLN
jgi:hypothetical protein